jgi:hypothetical protein
VGLIAVLRYGSDNSIKGSRNQGFLLVKKVLRDAVPAPGIVDLFGGNPKTRTHHEKDEDRQAMPE